MFKQVQKFQKYLLSPLPDPLVVLKTLVTINFVKDLIQIYPSNHQLDLCLYLYFTIEVVTIVKLEARNYYQTLSPGQ